MLNFWNCKKDEETNKFIISLNLTEYFVLCGIIGWGFGSIVANTIIILMKLFV